MSLAQLQAQKAATQQAYNNKQITTEQYNSWMSNWNQQYAAEQARQQQPTTTYYNRAEVQQKIATNQNKPTTVPVPTATTWTHQEAQQKILQNPPQNIAVKDAPSTITYNRSEVQLKIPESHNNFLVQQISKSNPELLQKIPQGSWITAYNVEKQEAKYLAPEQVTLFKESASFYSKAGYPQYGGKFSVPIGIKPEEVQSIKQVPNITYIPNTNIPQSTNGTSLEFTLKQAQSRELKNSTFSFSNLNIEGFFGQKPVIKTNEQRVLALEIIGSVIAAPVLGAAGTVKAAITGVGVSQAIKTGTTVYNGGNIGESLLTPREAVDSALGGVIFGGAGQVVNTGLKLTGEGAKYVGGRILTSTGLGTVGSPIAEYVQTGQITPDSAIQGGLFGLGFGVVSEGAGLVNNKVNVSGRVTGKVQDLVINRNLANLEQINDKFVTAFNENKMYIPTAKEKLVMKTTGVGPEKPTPTSLELPTIPTANPANYESYNKMVPREFIDTANIFKTTDAAKGIFKELPRSTLNRLEPISMKQEMIDSFKFKNEVFENKTFKQERTLGETGKQQDLTELSLYNKTLSGTELIDAGTVIKGRSVAPEDFFAKATPKAKTNADLPLYESWVGGADLREVPTKPEPLFFKKTPAEMKAEAQKPAIDKVLEPAAMVKERGKAFKDLGMASELQTDYIFSPQKGKPLSFTKPKTINTVKDLKENIDLFPVISKGDLLQDRAISNAFKNVKTESSKGDFMYRPTAEQQLDTAKSLINSGNISQGGKGRISQRDSAIIQELIGSERISGQEKYMQDIRLGQSVADTAKEYPISRQPTGSFNPAIYSGKSYYAQRTREIEETEYVATSYPNSGLSTPQAINTNNDLLQNTNNKQETISTPQVEITTTNRTSIELRNLLTPIVSQNQKLEQRRKIGFYYGNIFSGQTQMNREETILRTDQDLRLEQLPIQDIGQIQELKPFPIQDQGTKITPITVTGNGDFFYAKNTKYNFAPFPGSKFENFGGGSASRGKKIGVKSTPFVNPILEGAQLLGSKNASFFTINKRRH